MTTKSNDGEQHSTAQAESDIEKDLGVYVDSGLSFEAHIAQAVDKANKVMGIIRRTFDFLDEGLFLHL